MKVSATREHLLEALQSVIGVVERRQTMPILSNVLLSARDNRLRITARTWKSSWWQLRKSVCSKPGMSRCRAASFRHRAHAA